MPNTLLLRLPSPGQEETEWVTLNEAGEPTTTKQRGPLPLAAATGSGAKVVILAPATQILLAEPVLPPGGGVKLARAVPFALEEQLTEDIDALSFAIGKRRPGGGTPVAVVRRTLLTHWLAELRAAGLDPAALYADISLLPQNPSQTILWLEESRLAVRRPGMLPFAVELTPVSEALVVAGVIADPLDPGPESKSPESALLYVTEADWERVRDEFDGLTDDFASFKVQLLPEGALPWLARSLAGTDAVNLLQGEFARASNFGANWQRWRMPAALAAGLLVAHVTAQALQIHQANHQSAALDAEIAQLFAATMPSEKLHDPRRQMQSRLDRIRHAGAGPQYFLRTLQALSGAVSETPKTNIDALTYREQSLDMKVTAPSLASLSQLSQLVGKKGLIADIQSSTPVGDGVEAHMQVRSNTAKARP